MKKRIVAPEQSSNHQLYYIDAQYYCNLARNKESTSHYAFHFRRNVMINQRMVNPFKYCVYLKYCMRFKDSIINIVTSPIYRATFIKANIINRKY